MHEISFRALYQNFRLAFFALHCRSDLFQPWSKRNLASTDRDNLAVLSSLRTSPSETNSGWTDLSYRNRVPCLLESHRESGFDESLIDLSVHFLRQTLDEKLSSRMSTSATAIHPRCFSLKYTLIFHANIAKESISKCALRSATPLS